MCFMVHLDFEPKFIRKRSKRRILDNEEDLQNAIFGKFIFFTTTHVRQMEVSIIIIWVSPLSFYGG